MTPRFLRYRFPGEHAPATGAPEEHARALAHLFAEVPAQELSVARLDAIAGRWAEDPGSLDVAFGEAAGVAIAPWLQLVVGPGGRVAYLDVDLDALGRAISQAKASRPFDMKRIDTGTTPA